MVYSYHIELFGKKRLASTISALLDIMNDDDGSANLRCAKCKRRVERRAMMDLTKFKRSVAVLQSEQEHRTRKTTSCILCAAVCSK